MRTLAKLLGKMEFGNSGHSRKSTDEWNNMATEQLHPKVAS
jgi:hypothetical protein